MAAIIKSNKDQVFYVVHPLFDEPEEKIDTENLGPMKMTGTVKYSLLALQIYLIVMLILAVYRVLVMAGVIVS
jgi:hypothetical protein